MSLTLFPHTTQDGHRLENSFYGKNISAFLLDEGKIADTVTIHDIMEFLHDMGSRSYPKWMVIILTIIPTQ